MPSKQKLMNLIGIIFLTYRRQLQKELNSFQITFQQQRILQYLSVKEFLYPSEIAEFLYCDRPTASVVIKNIETKKWISKEKDSGNGKQVKIKLTDFGYAKLREINKKLKNIPALSYDQAECFTKDEQVQFVTLLEKFYSYIKENG